MSPGFPLRIASLDVTWKCYAQGILILSAEMGCGMGLIQTPMPFLWGGISGFLATCAVFPFDFVRVALAPPGTSKTTLFRAH